MRTCLLCWSLQSQTCTQNCTRCVTDRSNNCHKRALAPSAASQRKAAGMRLEKEATDVKPVLGHQRLQSHFTCSKECRNSAGLCHWLVEKGTAGNQQTTPYLLLRQRECGRLHQDGQQYDGEAIGVRDMCCTEAAVKHLQDKPSCKTHFDRTVPTTWNHKLRHTFDTQGYGQFEGR